MLQKEIFTPLNSPLKWGILGSARINEKIIPLIKNRADCRLVAHASRDSKKSIDYARQWGFEKSFDSYQELLQSSEVDMLYLSLPNSQHYEWAKKALLAGKHVLVEKPLVMSLGELRDLQNISKAKSLVALEGFMYAFHAQTKKLVELVQGGALGEIKVAKASFHFVLEDTQNIRLNSGLGGGAMWDLGCYLCHLMSLFWPQSEIVETKSYVERKHNVDVFTSALHRLDNGVLIYLDTGFSCPRNEYLEIQGTKGVLRVQRPIKATQAETLEIVRGPGQIEKILIEDPRNPYESEIDYFCKVLQGLAPQPELSELGLKLMLQSLKEV